MDHRQPVEPELAVTQEIASTKAHMGSDIDRLSQIRMKLVLTEVVIARAMATYKESLRLLSAIDRPK